MNLEKYPEIMKKNEVAEVLNIGRDKTNSFIKNGNIKVLMFGNSVRIRKSDLIDFIESHSKNETDEFYEPK